MRTVGRAFLAVAACLMTAPLVAAEQGAPATVTGTAAYRERIALLPGAVFEATLEDVSRPDSRATVLGTVRIENVSAIPIAFAIPYLPSSIEANHTYAVRGRILVDGTLAFTTDSTYPVLTRGAGTTVDLLLVRVRSDAPAAQPPGAPLAGQATASPAPPSQAAVVAAERDAVGDMNADAIRKGDFPGSIAIPGPGGVSFALGGFIKTLVFHDTRAEGREAVFLPAILGGVGRDDEDGTTSLSAELSRLNFDARATVGESKLRGYVEFDFSGDLFKWRHGYLSWSGNFGEVLAGKTWSTFMDLATLPDGLGEPTVSGAIFTRQAMFRYSRRLSDSAKLSVAIEDPASNDVLAAESVLTRTGFPDLIATLNFGNAARHVQVGGLVRSIEFDPNGGDGDRATGWGLAVSGHVNLGARDKVYGAFAAGDGVGRYMVGLAPAAGAFIDVEAARVTTRENVGGFAGLRHQWNQTCRSSVSYGYAETDNDPRQPAGAFSNSAFALGNILCKANRFLTIGFEVDYGKRENLNGFDKDNVRFMFGMQLF